MRQRGCLRRAGRAGGELNIDWVIRLQHISKLGEPDEFGGTTQATHAIQCIKSGLIGIRHLNDCGEMRQPPRPQRSRLAMVEFGCQLPQHANVVARLELVRSDQRPAFDLV